MVTFNSHMIFKELDAFSSCLEPVNSDNILEDPTVTAFNSPRILPLLDFQKNPIVTGFMRDVTETKVGFKILYPVHDTLNTIVEKSSQIVDQNSLTVLKLRIANRLAIMVLNPGAKQDCAINPNFSSAKQITSSPRFQSQLGMFNKYALKRIFVRLHPFIY